jgi:hypothetical protein
MAKLTATRAAHRHAIQCVWLSMICAPPAMAELPAMPSPTTSFTVESCTKNGSGLSATQSGGLSSRGLTKCVFGAFNVLAAGTDLYPDAYLLTTAIVIAELLDQDKDGTADGVRLRN